MELLWTLAARSADVQPHPSPGPPHPELSIEGMAEYDRPAGIGTPNNRRHNSPSRRHRGSRPRPPPPPAV